MAPRQVGSWRPREALLSGRAETLSDEALMTIVVGDNRGGVAGAILREHPVPDGLWRIRPTELMRMPGVGPARAARILACLEVSRRSSLWAAGSRPVISQPEDVVGLCGPQMRGRDREHFWALALNTKNRLIETIEVSVGSLNASIVHPRELYKDAVALSAASVVVVHNHPSGDPTPSGADIQLTERLVKAGDVIGIELLDHVIIGEGGSHSSLRELGLM